MCIENIYSSIFERHDYAGHGGRCPVCGSPLGAVALSAGLSAVRCHSCGVVALVPAADAEKAELGFAAHMLDGQPTISQAEAMARYGLRRTQAKVLSVLADYVKHNGYAPSMRELSDMAGISLNTAHHHVKMLKEKGLIETMPKKSRAISLSFDRFLEK